MFTANKDGLPDDMYLRRRIGAVVLSSFLLAGCADLSVKPADTTYQNQVGTVAVISTERAPILKFEGFARSKGEGAISGAGGTFGSCMVNIGHGSCQGSMCGAALLLLLGICGVAGIVGGVASAADAPSSHTVEASENTLGKAVEVRVIQMSIRDEVETAVIMHGAMIKSIPADLSQRLVQAKDYRPLSTQGVDTVLETTLIQAGTKSSGINEPLTAYLQVHARLVSTRDNTEHYAGNFVYEGKRLKLAEWSANDGKALLEAFTTGYRALSELIYDTIFELYPYPDRQTHSAGGTLSTAFGLAPISPATRGQLTGDALLGRYFEWTATDTLSPILRWQAFPRPSDVAAAPDDMGRVSQVTYDLVIAPEANLAPSEIVYQRQGLVAPEHKVEITLKPGTRYFWTVRAHFLLDGRARVTEWASTSFITRDQNTAPTRSSYRFRTPSVN